MGNRFTSSNSLPRIAVSSSSSPPSTRSLSALATVEQQLIMQCLQTRDILHLALCSRSLMHAANSTFAFRYANPVRRPFPQQRPRLSVSPATCPVPPQSILRHAPFILRWTLPVANSVEHADQAVILSHVDAAITDLMAFLAALPSGRLRGLDAEANTAWISEAQWKRILDCPAVQSIHFLALPRPVPQPVTAELIGMLHQLPLLSTLRVGDCDVGSNDDCSLVGLCDLPSLTSFDSSAYYLMWPPVLLRAVARCTHLTSLSFSGSNNNTDSILAELESSPSLASLRYLCLEQYCFREECLDEFFRIISRMSSLHKLVLAFCARVDLVLEHLPSLVSHYPLPSSFKTLCIQPILQLDDYLPRPVPVAWMLSAIPRIRCVLRIDPSLRNGDKKMEIRVAKRLRDNFKAASALRGMGRLSIDWKMPTS